MSTANSLTDEDLGSAAQRDRRTRILDATIALASQGGFDAVQMRAVAEQADVALGTLYRYFPSKIHLLVSALAPRVRARRGGAARPADPGRHRRRAGHATCSRATTRGLQGDPHLTEALTRAFMFADASVRAEIQAVGLLTDRDADPGDAAAEAPEALTDEDVRDRAGHRRRLALRARRLGHRPHRRATRSSPQIDVAVRLLLR